MPSRASLTVLMLAGLPGAGKSTLAHALGAALGWPVLDKDLVNTILLADQLPQTQAAPSQWLDDMTSPETESAWYAHLPTETLVLKADQPVEQLVAQVLTALCA